MKQDLMNWLNAVNADEEDYSEETGLLLAPIRINSPVNELALPVVPLQEESLHVEYANNNSGISQQNNFGYDTVKLAGKNETDEMKLGVQALHNNFKNDNEANELTRGVQGLRSDFEADTPEFAKDTQDLRGSFTVPQEPAKDVQGLRSDFEADTPEFANQAEFTKDTQDLQGSFTELEEPSASLSNDESVSQQLQPSEISHELHNLQEAVRNLQGTLDSEEEAPALSPDWKEANTGFELSLDEPPPEIWTKINNEKEDPEDLDYEQGTSLQGAAYIPKHEHGTNFTQRLQKTLQSRKNKAEAAREFEAEHKNHHPYIQKAMIICGTLLIVLFFVWLGLKFIQRETPEGMKARAERFYEQGKFDEAERIYQRAYKRYPENLIFLAGLAETSEKAGRIQTAKTAWEELFRNLPDNDAVNREKASQELKRLNKGDDEPKLPEPNEEKLESEKILPAEQPLTFDEYLREGNNAYNLGMYNRAVTNFFSALEIKSNDPRPYIGLAGAYRAKGLYFDAKVILDEARKKFRRNPTIETERKLLREAK